MDISGPEKNLDCKKRIELEKTCRENVKKWGLGFVFRAKFLQNFHFRLIYSWDGTPNTYFVLKFMLPRIRADFSEKKVTGQFKNF